LYFLNLERPFSFCTAKNKVPEKGLGKSGGVWDGKKWGCGKNSNSFLQQPFLSAGKTNFT